MARTAKVGGTKKRVLDGLGILPSSWRCYFTWFPLYWLS